MHELQNKIIIISKIKNKSVQCQTRVFIYLFDKRKTSSPSLFIQALKVKSKQTNKTCFN